MMVSTMYNVFKVMMVSILGIVILITCGCSYFVRSKMVKRIHIYEISQDMLNNPLIGYAPMADSITDVGDNNLVYIDILWSELEPKEGQFDFAKIDEENHVDKWISEGKHAVLRFVIDMPSDEKHMDIPKWLYDKIEGNGTFYNYDGKHGFSPDYNDMLLIKHHKLAIRALGSHYGNSSFISYIELGSLGHWGEWHVNYESGITRMPTANIRELYIKPYISAFPNKMILMRRPFISAREHGFGLFDDMAGHPTSSRDWLDWIQNGGDYSQALEENALVPMADSWKTAPIGGEFTSSYNMDYLLKFNQEATKDLLRRSHTSFLGPNCPTPCIIEKYDCGAQADEIKNIMGYRFRIREAQIAGARDKSNTVVTLTWVNDGIAPIYWDWDTFIYLYDNNQNFVEKVPVNIHLKELLPESEIITNTTVENSLSNEDVKYICIGIEDPMTSKPAVKFGMKTDYINNTAVIEKIGE